MDFMSCIKARDTTNQNLFIIDKEEYIMAKTREIKVIQGNYGYGWDDLCEYEKNEYSQLRSDFKAYEENEAYPHRIITRRIQNEN